MSRDLTKREILSGPKKGIISIRNWPEKEKKLDKKGNGLAAKNGYGLASKYSKKLTNQVLSHHPLFRRDTICDQSLWHRLWPGVTSHAWLEIFSCTWQINQSHTKSSPVTSGKPRPVTLGHSRSHTLSLARLENFRLACLTIWLFPQQQGEFSVSSPLRPLLTYAISLFLSLKPLSSPQALLFASKQIGVFICCFLSAFFFWLSFKCCTAFPLYVSLLDCLFIWNLDLFSQGFWSRLSLLGSLAWLFLWLALGSSWSWRTKWSLVKSYLPGLCLPVVSLFFRLDLSLSAVSREIGWWGGILPQLSYPPSF